MYREIKVKSALHRLKKGRLPYDWDLNIYRGCRHGCQYCYALYSHQYMKTDESFFDGIFVKTNIVEKMERELSSKKWRGEIINMGGVTDSYQEAEGEYGIMRDILKLMIKYKNPIIISTKSDLVLRDFDLISKLSELAYVNIAVTITTMNEEKRKKIEPTAVPPERRLNVLKEFKDTKANTGLHLMPILPFLTDSRNNIEKIFSFAKLHDANYVLTGCLNLFGRTRMNFLNFIKKDYPEHYNDYISLYKDGLVKKQYNINLNKIISECRRRYSISNGKVEWVRKEPKKTRQMKLL